MPDLTVPSLRVAWADPPYPQQHARSNYSTLLVFHRSGRNHA